MKRLCLALSVALALADSPPTEGALDHSEFTPSLDLRLRQEYLDDVLYFLPDPDRDQLRLRTRAGLGWERKGNTIQLRLANECRYFFNPDNQEMAWNEIVIDQLFWQWRPGKTKLTMGRQNIIWDDGFIMLESSPYDGSRTIYHNAVRWQKAYLTSDLDVAVIYNSKRDHLVLIGDKNQRLRDANEAAATVRYHTDPASFSYIFKQEHDPDHALPDLTTHTLGARTTSGNKEGLYWLGEISGQYLVRQDDTNELALAVQTILEFNLGRTTRGEAGFFAYDQNYLTPWGRWPKWSELYIYTLIGESTPGRVNVAGWENIAAPLVGVDQYFSKVFSGKVRALYLLAPTPDWQNRGLLLQARLNIKASSRWSGHLLWEMLNPGDSPPQQSEMTGTANFLRWEIIFKI